MVILLCSLVFRAQQETDALRRDNYLESISQRVETHSRGPGRGQNSKVLECWDWEQAAEAGFPCPGEDRWGGAPRPDSRVMGKLGAAGALKTEIENSLPKTSGV